MCIRDSLGIVLMTLEAPAGYVAAGSSSCTIADAFTAWGGYYGTPWFNAYSPPPVARKAGRATSKMWT